MDGAVAKAQALGLDTLYVKAWDGDGFGDNQNPTIFKDQFAASVDALKAKGFRVMAWGYLYGGPVRNWTSITPEREAAAVMASTAGADGIIFDAEYEYVNRIDEAARFFAALHVGAPTAFAPDFRILTGNARYTSWDANGVNLTAEPWPWATFLTHCEAVLPQLYFTDFQVSPSEVMGLVDTYQAACMQNNWPHRPVFPIWPLNATVADQKTAIGFSPNYSWWLLG